MVGWNACADDSCEFSCKSLSKISQCFAPDRRQTDSQESAVLSSALSASLSLSDTPPLLSPLFCHFYPSASSSAILLLFISLCSSQSRVVLMEQHRKIICYSLVATRTVYTIVQRCPPPPPPYCNCCTALLHKGGVKKNKNIF